jgi:ceramide glucosyltransferase
MPPYLEWLLIGWTALAAGWWLVALWLVRCRPLLRSGVARGADSQSRPTTDEASLSIFKPIPPASVREARAIESFVAQTDASAELLLGVEERDRVAWTKIVEDWRAKYPAATVQLVCVPRPNRFTNPRVSWQYTLAQHAAGELWLWSDADIVAPPGFLQQARDEFARSGCELLTFSYVVREIACGPMLLEAVFANVELRPGMLACARRGDVRFATGAGMMFRADTFARRVRWETLGARIADDFVMGNSLGPVRLSDATLETLAAETNWADALRHYLRWQKTIRWCRPVGFAGLVLLLPALGWLSAAVVWPQQIWLWLGLAGVTQFEALMALAICRRVGCRVTWRQWPVLAGWTLLRPLAWLWCWLPRPVVFRSQRRLWWNLYRWQPYGGKS